jgi:hypothetical protein
VFEPAKIEWVSTSKLRDGKVIGNVFGGVEFRAGGKQATHLRQ